MSTVGERLQHLREKQLKQSREKFIEGLDISPRTLSSYEKNETSPTAEFFEAVWAKYNKILTLDDFNWLLFGERSEGLPHGDYARVPLYDVEASAGGGAAVAGEEVLNVLAFRKDWLSTELRVSEKDLSLIFVSGESMEPTLRPGDMVLIVRQNGQPVEDGIYVVRLEDALLVKRLQRLPGGRLQVSSDNPAYKPFEIDVKTSGGDFVIIGKVVWAGRRF